MNRITLNGDDMAILNSLQKDFPVTERPFMALADEFGLSEKDLLAKLQKWQDLGVISRFGAVFNHKKAGSSALCAIAVPEEKLQEIGDHINQFEQINHNYQRDNRYNLWFVITTENQQRRDQLFNDIVTAYPYPALNLPMIKSFHIDLGFPLC